MKDVTIKFTTCIYADDPSMQIPFHYVRTLKIEPSLWDLLMKEDPQASSDFIQQFIVTSMEHAYNTQGLTWKCGVCGAFSCVAAASSNEIHAYTERNASQHLLEITVEQSIAIPVCGILNACGFEAKRRCVEFERRMQSISSNVEEFAGEQQTSVLCKFDLNADKPRENTVVKLPLNCKLSGPWQSIPQEEIHNIASTAGVHSIVKYFKDCCDIGVPYQCRECQKPATTVAMGAAHSMIDVGNNAVYISRDIAIPVCSKDLKCPCWVRAEQQVLRFMQSKKGVQSKEGTRAVYEHNVTCSNCGAFERKSKKSLVQCSRCRVVWYCSKKCQVKHWKAGHKKACTPWSDGNSTHDGSH